MVRFKSTQVLGNSLINFTQFKVIAAQVHGFIDVQTVHLAAVAFVQRVPDNGALIFICI